MNNQNNLYIFEEYHQNKQKIQPQCTSQSQKMNEMIEIYENIRKNVINFIQSLQQKTLTPIFNTILFSFKQKINHFYTKDDILSMLNQRIFKLIKNKNVKKNWKNNDIVLLIWFISKYMQKNNFQKPEQLQQTDWQFISTLMPGFSAKACMFKFVSLQKIKLSCINWSKDEQNILTQLVRKYGTNSWKQISQHLYEKNILSRVFRTAKQCREHWNCFLDPQLKKGPWKQEQDIKLIKNIKLNNGQKRWCLIKNMFAGRTENALKNRYTLLMEKEKKSTPNKSEEELINQFLYNKNVQWMDDKNNDYNKNDNDDNEKQNIQQQSNLKEDQVKGVIQNKILQENQVNKLQQNKNRQISCMDLVNSSFRLSSDYLEKLTKIQNLSSEYSKIHYLGSKIILFSPENMKNIN